MPSSVIINQDLEALGHALAGAMAGMASVFVIYPLDTYKTRVQIHRESIMTIIRREGFMSLYDGLAAGLLSTAMTEGVYFYFYSRLKKHHERLSGHHISEAPWTSLAVGIAAGAATQLTTLPFNVIHTRLQASKVRRSSASPSEEEQEMEQSPTFFSTLKMIYRTEGVRGFWPCIRLCLLLSVNPAITFWVFERLKHSFKTSAARSLNGYEAFAIGAFAKAVATVATFPLLLAKTRAQRGGRKAAILATMKTIVASEGVFGLYQGMGTKLIQAPAQQAFTLAFKEKSTKLAFFLLTRMAGRSRPEYPISVPR